MPEDLSKFHMPGGADPAWYGFGGIKDWVDGENDAAHRIHVRALYRPISRLTLPVATGPLLRLSRMLTVSLLLPIRTCDMYVSIVRVTNHYHRP